MKRGRMIHLQPSSGMTEGKSQDHSFSRRLAITFAGSGFVLLLAGGFAL